MESKPAVGFIGGGAMGSALAEGFLKANVVSSVYISDPNQGTLDRLKQRLSPFPSRVNLTMNNEEVCKSTSVIILAVKPQVAKVVLEPLRNVLTSNHLVISICAGISLSQLQSLCAARVVRVMPNTPALVQAMAAAFSPALSATQQDVALVQSLFSSLGVIEKVPEKLMDAVTGLSGSGPAFVFMFIESLADGGVKAGLPRSIALKLATQTVLGAAKLQQETGKHPGELKDMVASPGGTTIAGIMELENKGFRAAGMGAVVSAANRSAELSKKAAL